MYSLKVDEELLKKLEKLSKKNKKQAEKITNYLDLDNEQVEWLRK